MAEFFDNIADEYDFMNNIISLFLHKFVKKRAILEIKGNKILDICTGTGDIAGLIKLKYPDIDVVGIDISSKMLNIARKKHKNVLFYKEDASKTGFDDEVFDSVISSYGFRNIKDKTGAINEIKRILKTGGIFIHLDFYKKSKIYDIFLNFSADFFAKNKKAYEYLIDSKNNFKDPKEDFKMAGFKILKEKTLLFGMAKIEVFVKIKRLEVVNLVIAV